MTTLSVGIVGLPNVGKSTLFNSLTKNKAEASNYPFCTIDPNVGIVSVPDKRLALLAKTVGAKKIIPAVVEFTDIAGLVKNAHKGEGLGNQFLSHIRECDVIVEVIRDFQDSNIVHVAGKIDPKSDIETIKTELILADLETITKKINTLEKEVKKDSKISSELCFAKKIKENLEKGLSAREIKIKDEEKIWLKSFHLLSTKPHIYVFNVSEDELKSFNPKSYHLESNTYLIISAKVESELADFSEEEKREYLKELGINEPGLNKLILKTYNLLELQSFLTAGEKEVRAWTVKKGWKAPQAAGVIHTDFERGFIKAEVINWQDLVNFGGWNQARTKGKVRLEGKNYIVKDGDVVLFKANA